MSDFSRSRQRQLPSSSRWSAAAFLGWFLLCAAPAWSQGPLSDANLSFEVMQIGAEVFRIDEASTDMLTTAQVNCEASSSQAYRSVCHERRQLALAASHLYRDHLNVAMERLLVVQQAMEVSLSLRGVDPGEALTQLRASVVGLHTVLLAYREKDNPLRESLEHMLLTDGSKHHRP